MTPIAITIAGTTPLLCGRPAGDSDIYPDIRARAAARLYQGADGSPVIPSLNCFRSFIGAAKYVGRSPAEIVHGLGVAESELPIHAQRDWLVDTRIVRHPQTGERRQCFRPRFDDWRLMLTLLVDPDVLPVEHARALVTAAGQRVGLGDFRPDRGGPFGRFRIDAWVQP